MGRLALCPPQRGPFGGGAGICFASRRLPTPRASHRLAVALATMRRATSLRRSHPDASKTVYSLPGQKQYRSFDLYCYVPGAGIEPARPKSQDFKSCASTNSATRAKAIGEKIIAQRLNFSSPARNI